jgi:hypothetical protein
MPQFAPDQVTFKDIAGYGNWDNGHSREHLQFVQVLQGQSPPVLIPDNDLMQFLTSSPTSLSSQVQAHAQQHVLIQAALGITSIDLSAVDLTQENDFYNWLGYHASVHAAIRSALGIT